MNAVSLAQSEEGGHPDAEQTLIYQRHFWPEKEESKIWQNNKSIVQTMVAQRWQAAFCVGTPLEPDSRLPMPSYERQVAVRQDPTYLPSSDDNNNNEEDTTGKSSFKTQLSNEKACPENDQV